MTDTAPEGFDALIEAMTIFRKYDNPSCPFHCEHDTLHVCVDYDKVSEEDKSRLDILGFIEDADDGQFLSRRFGSA